MLTTDLSQHLALVTGATGGIGKATCLALAALGCSIAVHYNSAVDDAAELVQQLEAKGVKARAFQADMGIYQDVRFAVEFSFGNFSKSSTRIFTNNFSFFLSPNPARFLNASQRIGP
jgi:NAD(P)-dependent dehydrogenase (short-subunit alcohol dehydrogenase family)